MTRHLIYQPAREGSPAGVRECPRAPAAVPACRTPQVRAGTAPTLTDRWSPRRANAEGSRNPTRQEAGIPMARYRANRDNRETSTERTERIKNESLAEQQRRAEHYARQAEQAKRLAEQLRRGKP